MYSQSVPRSKHSVSVIQTSQLMLYREIIAVCSEIRTKHINTLCGQNVELLNVEPGGTYSDHWALNGTRISCTAVSYCISQCLQHLYLVCTEVHTVFLLQKYITNNIFVQTVN